MQCLKKDYFVCSCGAGGTGWCLSFVVMWWMVLAAGGVCGGGCIVDGLLMWWWWRFLGCGGDGGGDWYL